MNKKKRALILKPEDVAAMNEAFRQAPADMLLSETFRRHVAVRRWEERGKSLEVFDHEGLGTMPGTIAHNRQELDQSLFGSSKRTKRLLHPLSALEPAYGAPEKTTALSIGPRTEMEILHLLGLGFNINNIRAVDLISCSPWIELGDMHALPYPDRSFHIVISSWVLNYSSQPQLAVDEMCRVCADGGLIAIGVTYNASFEPGQTGIVGSMQRSVKDLTDLIGDKLARICFQDEPAAGNARDAVMLIARIKHTAPSAL